MIHVRYRLDSRNHTTLHMAASGSSPRAAQFLAAQTPHILHAEDARGARALHYCESTSVAEVLLDLGAGIDFTDHSGESALCYATAKGLGHVVETLCNRGAATDILSDSNWNPLHYAVANAMYGVALTLLGFGASVDQQDRLGNTPLHTAAQNSPEHILTMLLDNGANALVPNNNGDFALHVAVRSNNLAAVDILSRHNPELTLTPARRVAEPEEEPEENVDELMRRYPMYTCAQLLI